MNIIQGALTSIKPLPDSDFSDRLSYVYSTLGLIVSSAFVSGWSFVGSPIQCWFPAYYRGWWMEYALDYCYVQNTYFLPFTDIKPSNDWDFANHIIPYPANLTEREDKQLGYYQWVPFILALQAFFFYAPILLWRFIYASTGFQVSTICETCSIASNMEAVDRTKNMNMVANFLVKEYAIATRVGSRVRRATQGSSVIGAYLMTKVLFFVNALLQFILLKSFLGTSSYFWGYEVFSDLVQGIEWPETGNFPRVTFCDFEVRVMGNLHRHSVQCVLMINIFNEKIFLLLWFWDFFVMVISAYSLFYWLATGLTNVYGKKLIRRFTEKVDPSLLSDNDTKSLFEQFITEYVKADGVFLIRLIHANSGELITYALVNTLWDKFMQERRRPYPKNYPEPALLQKKPIDESEL